MLEATRERIDDLFIAALEMASGERTVFLDAECAGAPDLRERVDALLAAHDRAGAFLRVEEPAAPAGSLDGVRIGRYTIRRLIAEGGMGAVYEAEQENPRRVVALKLIRPGVASPSMVRRFELEAEVLGRLHHPGIAQIHEAGIAQTDFGTQPYFAMELIDGLPVVAYAEQNGLGTRARLELFAKICDAVHHAHQKGIIHRDLKPANVLVTPEGQPKILDFGVARAVDSDVQLTVERTGLGQLIGTMPYMSPEQAAGTPDDIDTRSDVYSLGVLGYELLAGRLPYDLHNRMIHEAVRIIREEEPSRLSAINHTFRGDVETIFARALEKTKIRRYPSAHDLAADIERYLNHEPIVARPASVGYQLGKFARRNKVLVASAALIVLSLGVGAVVSTGLYMKAQREVDAKSAALAFFSEDVVAIAAGGERPDGRVTLREALDRIPLDLRGRFDREPAAAGQIHQTLGQTYDALQAYDQALAHHERALVVRTEALGPEHRATLAARHDLLATTLAQAGTMSLRDDADRLRRSAADGAAALVAVQTRAFGADDPDTLRSRLLAAKIARKMKDIDAAEDAVTAVVADARRTRPASDPLRLAAIEELARLTYYDRGEAPAAVPLYREVYDERRAVLPMEHSAVHSAAVNLALALARSGATDEAQTMYEQTLALRRERLGPDHEDTRSVLNKLTSLHRRAGDSDASIALFIADLAAYRAREDELLIHATVSMNNLGTIFLAQGAYAAAEPYFEDALDVRRRYYGVAHAQTLVSHHNLAKLYRLTDRAAEAEALAEIATTTCDTTEVADAWRRRFFREHAACLIALDRFADAETQLREAQRRDEAAAGAVAPETIELFITLYEAMARPQDAAAWRERLPAPDHEEDP